MSIFDRLQNDGPTLVNPPPPKPYYTCDGCKHFERSMACSGGINGTPTFWKRCHEPSVVEETRGLGRSLNRSFHGEPYSKEVTPDWCPLLPKGVTTEDTRPLIDPTVDV